MAIFRQLSSSLYKIEHFSCSESRIIKNREG